MQMKLWGTPEVEKHFPSNRFEIEVKHMEAVAEGYVAPDSGFGPDYKQLGPQS